MVDLSISYVNVYQRVKTSPTAGVMVVNRAHQAQNSMTQLRPDAPATLIMA